MHPIIIWQNSIGMFLGLLFVSYQIYKKYDLLFAGAFAYCGFLTILYTTMPRIFYFGMEPHIVAGFQALITHAFLYFALLCLPFLFFKKDVVELIIASIVSIALLDSYFMLARFVLGLLPFGIMNNPAMDSSFIAVCLPFLIHFAFSEYSAKDWFRGNLSYWIPRFTIVGPPLFMCFATHTSSGVLGAGLAISTYLLAKNNFSKKSMLLGSAICIAIASVGIFIQYKHNGIWKEVFYGSGRYEIWRDSFKFWNNQAHEHFAPYINRLIGTGPGTFFMYGPNLQLNDALMRQQKGLDVFYWLHCDYLSILFECGFIGLFFAVFILSSSILKSRKNSARFASLCTFSAISVIQMPLRHWVFALMALCLVLSCSLNDTQHFVADNKSDKL